MSEPQATQRVMSTREWFCGGAIIGLIFAVLFYGAAKTGPCNYPAWVVFLVTFCGMQLPFIIGWLAARNAGNRNGIPIQ